MGLTPLSLAGRLIAKGKQIQDGDCSGHICGDREILFLLKEAAEVLIKQEQDLLTMTQNFYEIADTIDFGQ